MRISGLASGINTDDIIKQLMAANRVPMDKLSQQKQALEWKRDDYRELNNKILEFRNAAFDMKLESGYLAKKVSASQDDIVSVTGTAVANEGQYTIKVDQLAKAATLSSGDLAGAAGATKTLGSLSLSGDTQLIITGDKGSKAIDITTGQTVEQLVSAINSESATTGVKVNYDANMDRLFFNSAKTGASSQINLELANGDNISSVFGFAASSEVSQGNRTYASSDELINDAIGASQVLTVSYDGQDYDLDVTAATTVDDLISQMNEKMEGTGVTASLTASGKLTFANADAMKDITFSSDAGDQGGSLVSAVGVNIMTTNASIIDQKGSNARVEFNGIEAEYSSNTFSITGMTFTAKQASATVVDVVVSQDVDSVVDSIKVFVEKYNKLIEEVNKEVGEKKERDYQPLTSAQREELSEDEIERWEERARNGMLSNDSTLSNALNAMRLTLSNSISGLPSGQLNRLADIGISNSNVVGSSITGSFADKGKLYIDETKLRAALADNPDEVKTLFTANGATEAEDGIATRLFDHASALFKQVTDKAGTLNSTESTFSIGKENLRISEQMERLAVRLEDLETRYYRQFTAMEKYISQMNSQSAWLTEQFSS